MTHCPVLGRVPGAPCRAPTEWSTHRVEHPPSQAPNGLTNAEAGTFGPHCRWGRWRQGRWVQGKDRGSLPNQMGGGRPGEGKGQRPWRGRQGSWARAAREPWKGLEGGRSCWGRDRSPQGSGLRSREHFPGLVAAFRRPLALLRLVTFPPGPTCRSGFADDTASDPPQCLI